MERISDSPHDETQGDSSATKTRFHLPVSSSALIVSGVVGAYVRPSQRYVAGGLGLSSGALCTALVFDLFQEAFDIGGPSWRAADC